MTRMLIMAELTFREAVRRRILAAAFLLGLAFLLLFGLGFYYMRNDVFLPNTNPMSGFARTGLYNGVTLAGLYAVDFLAIAMAVLISADTLAGEIGTGTIQAIVTKPIRRSEIVLGKWLGFAALLALYLLLLAGGVVVLSYWITGYVVPNLAAGLLLIYLSALLMMTLTLALSSTLSTLATGGVIFGLYGLGFIGGWMEQFGALFQNQTAVNVGIISSLIIPSDVLWRRATYEMTPALTQALGISIAGPFFTLSLPSPAMVAYAGLYLLAALLLAVLQFSRRDL